MDRRRWSRSRRAPDLVLLEVMMARLDGFPVTQKARERSAAPTIILTKPLSVEELLARMRAVMRRAQFATDPHELSATTVVGELSSDYARHLVTMGAVKSH